MNMLLSILHPLRTTRIFVRMSMGKPAFKPGSRKDRRYQANMERAERKIEAAEQREYEAAVTSKPTSDVWEMEIEDWEESGE